MYLITYCWKYATENSDMGRYAMRVVECPIAWLLSMQKWEETYILINAHPITEEQAKQIDGKLKGM